MILVIGPTGSGKTLLLKRLEEFAKNSHSTSAKKKDKNLSDNLRPSSSDGQDDVREKVPATMPTIGTNICNVAFGRRKEITLKEIGGSMAPLWKSSYKDAKKVIYVIDISNPFQVSCTTVRLLDMISATDLHNTPVLILLNKIDGFSTVSPVEMKTMLMLESIVTHAPQNIETLETSFKYGSGLQDVIDWVYKDT